MGVNMDGGCEQWFLITSIVYNERYAKSCVCSYHYYMVWPSTYKANLSLDWKNESSSWISTNWFCPCGSSRYVCLCLCKCDHFAIDNHCSVVVLWVFFCFYLMVFVVILFLFFVCCSFVYFGTIYFDQILGVSTGISLMVTPDFCRGQSIYKAMQTRKII